MFFFREYGQFGQYSAEYTGSLTGSPLLATVMHVRWVPLSGHFGEIRADPL